MRNHCFITILGLTPRWDYEPVIENKSQRKMNITIKDKPKLEFDCIDGSILNDSCEPILFSFLLDGLLVYTFFVEENLLGI